MTKWEYRVDTYMHYSNTQLNEIGQQGWELTAVTLVVKNENLTGRDVFNYYFKRPK